MLNCLLLRPLIGLHDQTLQHGFLRYAVTAGKALQGAFDMQIDQQTQTFKLIVLIFQMPRSVVRLPCAGAKPTSTARYQGASNASGSDEPLSLRLNLMHNDATIDVGKNYAHHAHRRRPVICQSAWTG